MISNRRKNVIQGNKAADKLRKAGYSLNGFVKGEVWVQKDGEFINGSSYRELAKRLLRSNTMIWVYSVVLWDDTGNVMLEKELVRVKSVKKETALNKVRRKYPWPYFIELKDVKKPKENSMKHDIYQDIKSNIEDLADRLGTSDLPARREALNDFLDSQIKEMNNTYVLRDEISEAQGALYETWLTNYTIKRHEK